jgi:hypothetical protein
MDPWKDEERLREAYREHGAISGVADEFGCSTATVHRWMKRFGIETRPAPGDRLVPSYRTWDDGYVRVGSTSTGYVAVHHLIAIAEGVPPDVFWNDDRDVTVHHENSIPWDNRWENIDLMDRSEHGKLHRAEQLK